MPLPSCAAGWVLLSSILIDMFNRSLEQRCVENGPEMRLRSGLAVYPSSTSERNCLASTFTAKYLVTLALKYWSILEGEIPGDSKKMHGRRAPYRYSAKLVFPWHDALMLKSALRRTSAHASTGLILEILERCT
jgi:hypothetical protein